MKKIDLIYCCPEIVTSVKEGFLEVIDDEIPPRLEYDTDGRWIEDAKYCHHCGKKIEFQTLQQE